MRGVSPLLTTMSMTVLGTAFLAGLSLYEDGGEMLYMVICGTLIGYIVFNKGVEELGASKASMYLNFPPHCSYWHCSYSIWSSCYMATNSRNDNCTN